MLSPDDAALVARDRGLPGLATVLDDAALAHALAIRAPALRVRGARRVYARYKPGHSCVVAFKLRERAGELDGYARAHRPDSFARLAGTRGGGGEAWLSAAHARGRDPILIHDACVAIRLFPHDRRLPALAELADENRRAALLGELLPERREPRLARIETLRYWPERRYTCRLTGHDGAHALLKAHSEQSFAAAARNATLFASRGPLRLARLLGRSDRHRVLAYEWLPGERLGDAMDAPHVDAAVLGRVGEAVAELHSRDIPGLQAADSSAEAAFLMDRAAWVGFARPDLAEAARSLALRLAAPSGGPLARRRPIHGDFSANQVLVSGSQVAVIDLDDARLDDPAADLGVFAAQLELRVLQGSLARERAEMLLRELLAGYGVSASSPFELRSVRMHLARELLARAPGTFRRGESGWLGRLEHILRRAEQLAEPG